MSDAVKRVEVTNDSLAQWGVSFYDYKISIDGKMTKVDLQDLLVAINAQRAKAVEKEVAPMSTKITNRNTRLTGLGTALSSLSERSSKFSTDEQSKSDKTYSVTIDETTAKLLNELAKNAGKSTSFTAGTLTMNYANAEYYTQLVKTAIDTLNNESSADTTRLQSLISRRDESFTAASTVMNAISDTRSSLIKGIS